MTPQAMRLPAFPAGWVVKSSGWSCMMTVRPITSSTRKRLVRKTDSASPSQPSSGGRSPAWKGWGQPVGLKWLSAAEKRVGGAAAAGASLVDVESEEAAAAGALRGRQAGDVHGDDDAVGRLVKEGDAVDAGVQDVAAEVRPRLRRPVQQRGQRM